MFSVSSEHFHRSSYGCTSSQLQNNSAAAGSVVDPVVVHFDPVAGRILPVVLRMVCPVIRLTDLVVHLLGSMILVPAVPVIPEILVADQVELILPVLPDRRPHFQTDLQRCR